MTTFGKQPIALVTGAAHRLGREIALHLAALGYDIALHYNQSAAQARQTAQEIGKLGVSTYLLKANLTHPDEVEALFEDLYSLSDKLDVLVNSAAVMPRASLLEMDIAAWDDTLNLNLRAPWLCARYASRLMQKDGGNIINITDSGADCNWTGYAAYTLSKSALQHLTRLLARTLAPAIRVNAIAPGLVLPPPEMPKAEWHRLVDRLPLQHAAQPNNINQAVEYLLKNMHVTGQTLVVDGGYQLL